jgi:hypothetical protein
MSPKARTEKQIAKINQMREIIHELMDCETEAELNATVETYKDDIMELRLQHHVASTIKRIKAVEINHRFNNHKS